MININKYRRILLSKTHGAIYIKIYSLFMNKIILITLLFDFKHYFTTFATYKTIIL